MDITNQTTFKLRVTAIFLVAAGYGWAGGHFIPGDASWMAYLFQGVILLILLILSLGFFSDAYGSGSKRWPVRGLSIFTILSLLINATNVIVGAAMGQHSFGSHNTFADLVPISVLVVGDVLWLITLILGKTTAPKEMNAPA